MTLAPLPQRWKLPETPSEASASLAAAAHIPEVIAQLLISRGITTPEAAATFLHPEITHLHDPLQMLEKYAGKVGYIQLGFVHQGIVFLHETTTEWYERYQELLEGIESFGDILLDDPDGENEDV